MHQYCLVCGFSSFFLGSAVLSRARSRPRWPAQSTGPPEVVMSISLDLPADLHTPPRSSALRLFHQVFVALAEALDASDPTLDPARPLRIAVVCPPPCS